jgi:hypothetical protein
MIIPWLYGRLGNQCFQIAAAIAHAKKMGTSWGVPHKTLEPRLWPMYFRNLPFTRHVTIAHYKEFFHSYDPLPLQKDMTIDGYFQSEKYFVDAKEDVSSALGFSNYNGWQGCAIHIRRGDYLQYPDQFPVLPMEYYQSAITRVFGAGINEFFIFTDDEKWCAENVNNLEWWGSSWTIMRERNKGPLAHMQWMNKASAFIIANSSFSLFPALLRTDNPLVIAPDEHRWYGPKNSHLETKDLMPERFIKL